MYVALYNSKTKEILYNEHIDDEAQALGRFEAFSIDAAQWGPDFVAYRSTDKPFAFPTPAELAVEAKAVKVALIRGQLAALDAQSLRSLRAIAAGTATTEDKAKLADLEAQAVALRAEMEAL